MGKIGFYTRQFENQLDGETMYVATKATYSELSAEDMVEAAARNQRVDEQNMRVGMYALSDAILNFVMNGHSVTIEGLGCFFLSCKCGLWDDKKKKWKSAGKTSMDDVSARDIRGIYVRFRPCTALRERMKLTEFYDITASTFLAKKGGYKIVDGKPVGKTEEPKP